uniref:Uncharacterized protein n=1 Tax=Plectus sambesii TaxID=2011161 RepID=A0A914WW98_9BILA
MATEGQFGSIPSAPAKSLPTSSAVGAQPGFGTGPLSGSASAANTIESAVEVGDKAAAAGVESKNGGMDLLSLAKTFSSFLNPNAASSRQSASSPEVARASSPLTRLAPGASDNFGIPQGEG